MAEPTTSHEAPGTTAGDGAGSCSHTQETLGQYILQEKLGEGGMGAVYKAIHSRLKKAFALSEAFGGSYRFQLQKGYPSAFNHAHVNDWMRTVVRDLDSEDNIVEADFGMGAEDFAYMMQLAPGAMFMLGAATEDGVWRGHHTPVFDIDERVMPFGAAILAETARRYVTGKLAVD